MTTFSGAHLTGVVIVCLSEGLDCEGAEQHRNDARTPSQDFRCKEDKIRRSESSNDLYDCIFAGQAPIELVQYKEGSNTKYETNTHSTERESEESRESCKG